jgi:hypothetical protein
MILVYLSQNLVLQRVFGKINDWFKINLLSLNFDKTYYVQFLTKNNHEINIHISYGNKLITNIHSTNFLGLITDSTLSWKNHIDKLMSKLSLACYAIRAVKSLMTQESLRIIYFSYFHCYDIWYNFLGQFFLLQ